MQLTRATDFSLRVLMFLDTLENKRARSIELAHALAIPRHQVMKIVQRLARAGYLNTARGKGGGVELARHAVEISLGEVIRRMEPNLAVVNCLSPACPLAGACRLKHALDQASTRFLQHMDALSLADVASSPGRRGRSDSLRDN